MKLATVRTTNWPGLYQLAVDALRALWQDLNPASGRPLGWLPGRRGVWLAHLPHLLLVGLAVVLGTVTAGEIVTTSDRSLVLAVALGAAQGLPVVVALVRPVAGWWLSLLVGMVVSEVVRPAGTGRCGPSPACWPI